MANDCLPMSPHRNPICIPLTGRRRRYTHYAQNILTRAAGQWSFRCLIRNLGFSKPGLIIFSRPTLVQYSMPIGRYRFRLYVENECLTKRAICAAVRQIQAWVCGNIGCGTAIPIAISWVSRPPPRYRLRRSGKNSTKFQLWSGTSFHSAIPRYFCTSLI